MLKNQKTSRLDLVKIRKRVKQKRQDYIRYNFSPKKNDILKTFFDLAQEVDSLSDLFRVCVSIPLESLELESRLYLFNHAHNGLELVCDSIHGVYSSPPACPDHVHLSEESYEASHSYLAPIFTKTVVAQEDLNPNTCGQSKIIGMFEVFPLANLTKEDKFFFIKYSNRIGYNLGKRLLSQQNIEHLDFIKNLVSDIEHNVIIPNMYFKHLFNQLKKSIGQLEKTTNDFEQLHCRKNKSCNVVFESLVESKSRLFDSYKDIINHHLNQSLFLESLFRRDHFEEGRFVLRRRVCKLVSEIIAPQLKHYEKRMIINGITIDNPVDMLYEEIEIDVDFGLLSQVYANLFSNAVKYTEEVVSHTGKPRKLMAYGRKVLYNHFGPGRAGIKLNVFSTGPHLSDNEAKSVFKDGYRGDNSFGKQSSGHGLAFVKYVVELHAGEVGYEPTVEGNNYYFILPVFSKSIQKKSLSNWNF